MEKETYIIDFQAFKDERNRFILKELAIISMNANKIVHCIIKPPYHFDTLFSHKQKQVMWLSRYFHGLQWEDGYLTPKSAIALLRETVKTGEILLIKGSERCKFLQQLFPTKIILDLDDLACPPAKQLPEFQDSPQCFHYNHVAGNSGNKDYACSLNYVYKFKMWCEQIHLNIIKKRSILQEKEEKQLQIADDCDADNGADDEWNFDEEEEDEQQQQQQQQQFEDCLDLDVSY